MNSILQPESYKEHTDTRNMAGSNPIKLDKIDQQIIRATQSGLPLDPQPYTVIAKQLDLSTEDVITRFKRMLAQGIVRRIAAVPNHYALGYRSNGMSVWDVPDDRVHELGTIIGQLDFVSHCYQRPRYLPSWPYNLFAMVHAHDRQSAMLLVEKIAELIGKHDRGHDVLFSTRILKKTGMRLPF